MIFQNQILGRESGNCRWINMGNNNWQWVCFSAGGGANVRSPQLLGVQKLSPQQLINLSRAGLLSLLQQSQNEVAYIQQELNNPNISEETKVGMRANLTDFMAQVAAIQAWLSLTPHQQATTDGAKFIQNKQSSFKATLNKFQNQNQNNSDENPITKDYAGLPLWAWVGIVGAGLYIGYEAFSSNKKTKRIPPSRQLTA